MTNVLRGSVEGFTLPEAASELDEVLSISAPIEEHQE